MFDFNKTLFDFSLSKSAITIPIAHMRPPPAKSATCNITNKNNMNLILKEKKGRLEFSVQLMLPNYDLTNQVG